MDYADFNARKARPQASQAFEVIEFPGPEPLVTEEPLDEISARRFLTAAQRRRLELAESPDEPLAEFLQQIL